MDDPEAENRASELAVELRRILDENLFKDPKTTDKEMERVREIREEIEALGFFVQWGASFSSSDPNSLEVEVNLYKPKENLSPELQKMYNDWLIQATLRRNRKT
ncbi:MAG: hypothetical protein A3B16_01925 [Candidatus Zambryskibacteria bacterium RIFCSPLOWO2_01_FULL_45_43]|uniref:Uncharacterized protein n=2 Tax=Parcubacteria group TaxID=1794811 RepID=A0A1G1ZTC0_9BACT|nr:MAG: hypothetical protein A3H63_01355 [Candidatus Harrisonbacteria bacterium RIFCSPLOWO2_02_FULL_45_10c]OHB06041.1 MAG: hypothetical protein A3B16_01925 [Candidatus Zambryskibacteria bacterium RIFCSPLOWO2_01_FULL_45_43]